MDIKAIKKTQELAKLVLSKERFTKLAENFSEIIKYINTISSADVDKYKDSYNNSGLKNVVVKDETQKDYSLTQKQATKNAAKSREGYIVVPRVIKSN